MKKLTKSIILGILIVSLFISCTSRDLRRRIPYYTIEKVEGEYDLWGYIDKHGNVLIDFQWDYAYPFVNGSAVIMKYDAYGNKKFGLIDKDGRYLVKPKYDYVYGRSENYIVFNKGGGYFEEKTNVSARGYTSAIWYGGGGCDLYDNYGNLLMKTKYSRIIPFKENIKLTGFKVQTESGELWGFMNRDGEVVIEPEFNQVDVFQEGFTVVSKKIKEKTSFNFIDSNGKLISGEWYDSASRFKEGLACVKVNGKWGYINTDGKIQIPPKFNRAYSFQDGQAIVGIESDSKVYFGVIDKQGNYLFKFDELNQIFLIEGRNNYIVKKENGERVIFNRKGEKLGSPYKWRVFPISEDLIIYLEDIPDYIFGVMDYDGNIIKEPFMDDFGELHDGCLVAKEHNGKYGIIDLNWNWIVKPEYEFICYTDNGIYPASKRILTKRKKQVKKYKK